MMTPDPGGRAETAEPVQTSLAVLDMARTGRFAQIRDLFAPQLRAMVPAEALQAAWDAELARNGAVASAGPPVSEAAGPGTAVVRIPVTYERGTLTLVVSVSGGRWLTGLQLAPASAAEPVAPWQPPAYADPEKFREQDVTLGSGPLAVPGTLSLPRRPGPRAPYPAVVLLAGSGPLDRDETIGRNKPLKDLAWGLASRGVAVLRFDKVTYAHPGQVKEAQDFTLADEYLPAAAAANDLLRQHPAAGAGPVFVLGHSLGGTVAPRAAGAEPSVAGLVIMAGGTQPMHWAAVRQVRYLASLDPGTAAAAQPAIDAMTRQAQLVDSPGLSPSTSASDLPFGVPAAYWLDVRGPGRRGAGQADTHPAGRARLPGDSRRRPRRMGGRPRGPPGRHHPRLRRRQPPVLPGHRPVRAGRVRACPAHGPGGHHRHRRLAGRHCPGLIPDPLRRRPA